MYLLFFLFIKFNYELDADFKPVKAGGEYLDPEAAREAITAVANQGKNQGKK